MGFFSKVTGFFATKYTPVEALEYLRVKSAWFKSQDHVLQGVRPQFRNEFLKLAPGNSKSLTTSMIEDYAKKAFARITINRPYESMSRRLKLETIGQMKKQAFAQERKQFEARMAAAFYEQDKLVQKAIHECGNTIQNNSQGKNRIVQQTVAKVKNEVRSLEHDLVRVIRKNRGIGHEEAAILRDALRKEINEWEVLLQFLDKRIIYHFALPMNTHNKNLAIEVLHNLNNQITKSMQEFAAIERVQFNIQMMGDEKTGKLTNLIKFPIKSETKFAKSA